MILLPTVKHTGTNYLISVLNREKSKLTLDRKNRIKNEDADIIWSHFDHRMPHIVELSKRMKTVIPLRHPARIAISWRKRSQSGWLDQWMRMCQVEAFHFPMETKPFDELEEFVGFELNRHNDPINTIGDYIEKHVPVEAGYYLGAEWGDVMKALDTNVGRKYYSGPVCGFLE